LSRGFAIPWVNALIFYLDELFIKDHQFAHPYNLPRSGAAFSFGRHHL